jgi:hypothetical protein
MHIVDRRLNPGSKSFENRQRFLRRAKARVEGAAAVSGVENPLRNWTWQECESAGELARFVKVTGAWMTWGEWSIDRDFIKPQTGMTALHGPQSAA